MARGIDQHRNPKSDIEIAQAAAMRPIVEVAEEKLGIPGEAVSPYGRYKAKISLDYIRSLSDRRDGKLILVTAITPTPAGEGKTTTTVGLGSRRHRIAFLPIWLSASPSPTVVVVLPSPAGVGVIAVTRISLPLGRSQSERM